MRPRRHARRLAPPDDGARSAIHDYFYFDGNRASLRENSTVTGFLDANGVWVGKQLICKVVNLAGRTRSQQHGSANSTLSVEDYGVEESIFAVARLRAGDQILNRRLIGWALRQCGLHRD